MDADIVDDNQHRHIAVTVVASVAAVTVGSITLATSAELPLLSGLTILVGLILLSTSVPRRFTLWVGAAASIMVGWTVGSQLADGVLAATLIGIEIFLVSVLCAQLAGSAPTESGSSSRRDLLARSALLEVARAAGASDRGHAETALAGLRRALGRGAIVIWRNDDTRATLTAIPVCMSTSDDESVDPIEWVNAPEAASSFSVGRGREITSVDEIRWPARHTFEQLGAGHALEQPVVIGGRWAGHVTIADGAGSMPMDLVDRDAIEALVEIVSTWWDHERTLTEMQQVVDQRDHSLSIQRAISESARLIFESDSDRPDQVLELVLTAVEADVAFLFDLKQHAALGLGIESRAVALAPGAPIDPLFAPGTWSKVPHHYLPVLAGQPVIIGDTSELASDARRSHERQMPATRAEMAFPITSGDQIVAMVGLASVTPRHWNAADIRTMSTIGQMMGVARARADAHTALEGIVRAKDRFIASVSHELRTPMAVVMGLSSELNTNRGDFSDREVEEFIDLIARQSREVTHIIEDLLVAARASAASITVIPELIRLDEVVSDALDSMTPEQTHRIHSTQLAAVSSYADPMRVHQIVRNLVANGHRYGGTRIFIRVLEVDGAAVLEVADDGPGIPDDRRAEIFEAYSGGEMRGRTGSIGLGLTVCRQLARLMGGDVIYVHEPMPTFRLTLPIGSLRVAADIEALAG